MVRRTDLNNTEGHKLSIAVPFTLNLYHLGLLSFGVCGL